MKRFFGLLVLTAMIVMILAPACRAESAACEVSMTTLLNGREMYHEGAYYVSGGEEIQVSAHSLAGIYTIGYYFYYNGEKEGDTVDISAEEISITVPEYPAGSYAELYVEAVANNDDGTPNTITKTGWYKFYLLYSDYAEPVDMTVSLDGETWVANETYAVAAGEVVKVAANSNAGIAFIGYYYYFDDEGTAITDKYDDTMDILIPDKGEAEEVYLFIDAVGNDDGKTGWQMYHLQYE